MNCFRYSFLKYRCIQYMLVALFLLISAASVYGAACYFIARSNTVAPSAVTAPSAAQTPKNAYLPNDFLFLHQVNSPKRIAHEENSYNNFEIDIYPDPSGTPQLYAAHDDKDISAKDILLGDLFAALNSPARYDYWLDIKAPLSQEHMDYVKTLAAQYGILPNRIIFEPSDDDTAVLARQNGFNILLFTPGFKEDLSAQDLAALIKKTEDRIARLQPMALSGGISSYPMFKTYFPNYRKAIYYTTTKRPSLKKYFLKRFMKRDPQVAIFLIDEYSFKE